MTILVGCPVFITTNVHVLHIAYFLKETVTEILNYCHCFDFKERGDHLHNGTISSNSKLFAP